MNVVVILANWMDADGNLNAQTTARVEAGIALLNAGATHLLLMGWAGVPGSDLSIATAMQRYCLVQGVPASAILTDDRSRDTAGDAIFARLTLDRLTPATPITVVTSDYHIPRAQHVFGRVFGATRKVAYVGAHAIPSAPETEAASMAAFDSTFSRVADGDIDGFVAQLLSDHPYYNGAVHPAITLPD